MPLKNIFSLRTADKKQIQSAPDVPTRPTKPMVIKNQKTFADGPNDEPKKGIFHRRTLVPKTLSEKQPPKNELSKNSSPKTQNARFTGDKKRRNITPPPFRCGLLNTTVMPTRGGIFSRNRTLSRQPCTALSTRTTPTSRRPMCNESVESTGDPRIKLVYGIPMHTADRAAARKRKELNNI